MKTFLFASIIVAVCFLAVAANSQQKVSASKPENVPTIPSGEKYFAVFLAHQDAENTIPMSHTFAVFMRTSGDGANRKIIETATINWLPKSGHVSIVRPAEEGVNKTLAETLEWAKERNLEVSISGPYEIDADFYQHAAAQASRLHRGEFKYRCRVKLRHSTKNCIYAVADIFENEPPLDTGAAHGRASMLQVVEYFRPKFKSEEPISSDAASLLADLKLDAMSTAGTEALAAE